MDPNPVLDENIGETKKHTIVSQPAPHLNVCMRCGKKPGKWIDRETGQHFSVYLVKDRRGFMMCNYCDQDGFVQRPTKMTKAEKKKLKKMKKELRTMVNLPHVTLDRQGNQVL